LEIMVEKTVTIKNRAGIHARPAALLVQTANRFSSSIFLEKDGEKINGKSIMGILTLAATYNSPIKIIADGSDEEDALQTICRLFETKFEEE
jgi:phosphocarrier protein HPr